MKLFAQVSLLPNKTPEQSRADARANCAAPTLAEIEAIIKERARECNSGTFQMPDDVVAYIALDLQRRYVQQPLPTDAEIEAALRAVPCRVCKQPMAAHPRNHHPTGFWIVCDGKPDYPAMTRAVRAARGGEAVTLRVWPEWRR